MITEVAPLRRHAVQTVVFESVGPAVAVVVAAELAVVGPVAVAVVAVSLVLRSPEWVQSG